MDSIGRICGYCVVWWHGTKDRGDFIPYGALKLAPVVRCNVHHIDRACFAGTADKTLEIGIDRTGVWFSAALPPTPDGYSLLRGLEGGHVLNTLVELEDETHSSEWMIGSGTVTGLAIVPRGAASFLSCRCWLAGETPTDPWARELHQHFQGRRAVLPDIHRPLARRHGRKAQPIPLPPIPEAMARAWRMGLG
jgi:hypothetical protein